MSEKTVSLRVTYDREADAAYLALIPNAEEGSLDVTKIDEVTASVNLDRDVQGKILGIEILNASYQLPESLLNVAQDITRSEFRSNPK
jgi:uncharacterized protein YuzE